MDSSCRTYRSRWTVLFLYMGVAAFTQLFWLNFAAIETYLEARMGIPAGQVMWLTLVFPLIQVLLTLPAGLIIDRRGFKFGVGLGAALTAVFSLTRLIDPSSFVLLLLSQAGIAVGQPFVLNGVTKLASVWFPPREEATAVGLGSLALFIGMIVALGATPWLVESRSLTFMLAVYGAAAAAAALAFLVFVRPQPPTPSRPDEPEAVLSSGKALRHVLGFPDFVKLGFVAFAGIGAFNGLASWLEKILSEGHGLSMTAAGQVSAALIFSGMIGCFVIPLISDKIGRRKPFLLLSALAGAAAMAALIVRKSMALDLANGIGLGFFLIAALPIMLTMSAEITGPKYAGLSVGYLQLLGNIGAVALVAVMELLRGASGGFAAPLLLLSVLLAGAFLLAFFIKETGRRGSNSR